MEGLLKLKRRHFNALALVPCALAAAGSLGPALAQDTKDPLVLVVGDSLSAEYGLKRGTGWVALLSETMVKEKVKARVVNASISGDTTSGGRSRIAALLKQHKPRWVVIELGGNDALRGLPLNMTRENIATMARLSREAGAQVLLLGMEMPPNYGAKYGQEFREVFTTVAKAEKTALVPFFLKDVADTKDPTALFQNDRIHPNESAQPTMRDNALSRLAEFDLIIDARTEDEHALDHVPGAVNWPTLDNEERITIGTMYKQVNPFEAKKRGAALSARNIAAHIEREVIDKPRTWKPLVYCWRGGNRSGALATNATASRHNSGSFVVKQVATVSTATSPINRILCSTRHGKVVLRQTEKERISCFQTLA
eukprot:gene40023-52848_t